MGVGSELRGVVVNLVGEGRGEKKDLNLLWEHSEFVSCEHVEDFVFQHTL